jgi:hypothetical protein
VLFVSHAVRRADSFEPNRTRRLGDGFSLADGLGEVSLHRDPSVGHEKFRPGCSHCSRVMKLDSGRDRLEPRQNSDFSRKGLSSLGLIQSSGVRSSRITGIRS